MHDSKGELIINVRLHFSVFMQICIKHRYFFKTDVQSNLVNPNPLVPMLFLFGLRYYIIDPGKNLSCSITTQNLILMNVLDDEDSRHSAGWSVYSD